MVAAKLGQTLLHVPDEAAVSFYERSRVSRGWRIALEPADPAARSISGRTRPSRCSCSGGGGDLFVNFRGAGLCVATLVAGPTVPRPRPSRCPALSGATTRVEPRERSQPVRGPVYFAPMSTEAAWTDESTTRTADGVTNRGQLGKWMEAGT